MCNLLCWTSVQISNWWVVRTWTHKTHPFSAPILHYHIINISFSFFFSLSFQYFIERKRKCLCYFYFFFLVPSENIRTWLIKPAALEKRETSTIRHYIWFYNLQHREHIRTQLFPQCHWLLPLCFRIPALRSL